MANAAPIRVDIVGNARGLSATVDLANAKLNTMAATAARASAATDRLEANMNRANAAMAAVTGAAGAGIVFKQLADAAGAAQTATRSMTAVFKVSNQQMIAAAKAGDQVGLSFAAYGQVATRLGAQLGNMGFHAGEVGNVTQDLIQHAADLSATFGGDVTAAIDAMSAVFRKEMDPIEKYGVTMKAADIEARAAAEGITYGQAAIAAIMEQTGYAMGAFENNADTYNVQMQKMAAATENAKADMGAALLPLFGDLASGAQKVAGALEAIPDPIQSALTQLALMGAGMKLAMVASDALTARLFAQQAAVAKTRGAWSLAAMSYGAAGATMEKAGTAIKVLTAGMLVGAGAEMAFDIDNGSAAVSRFIEQLSRAGEIGPETTGMLDDIVFRMKILADPRPVDRINAFGTALAQVFGYSGGSRNQALEQIKEFDRQLADMARNGNTQAAQAGFQALVTQLEGTGVAYDEIVRLMPEYAAATDGATEATNRISAASNAAAETFASLKTALDAVSDAQKNWQAIMSGSDLIASNAKAQAAYVAALQETQKVVKDNGRALRGWTAEQIALGEASRSTRKGVSASATALTEFAVGALDAARSSGEATARMYGAEAGVRAAGKATRQARTDFIDLATAMGVPKQQARLLADMLGLIPSKVRTDITTTGVARAQADAAAVQTALNAIDRYVAIQVAIRTTGAAPGQVKAAYEQRSSLSRGADDAATTFAQAAASGGSDTGSFYEYGKRLGESAMKGLRKSLSKDVLFTGKIDLSKFDVRPFKDKLSKAQQEAFDKGSDSWDKMIDRAQNRYDRLFDRLDNRRQKLADARQSILDWRADVADSIMSGFDLNALLADTTKVIKSWDHLDPLLREIAVTTDPERLRLLNEQYTALLQAGPREIVEATQTMGEKLREQLAQTRTFAKNLTELQASGLSAAALQTIIDAGADAGGELASALLADPALLREYDTTYAQMTAKAREVSQALVPPPELTYELDKWKAKVQDARKDLRTFWRDFRKEAEKALDTKFKIDVVVDWKWATKPGAPANVVDAQTARLGGRSGQVYVENLYLTTGPTTTTEDQARQTVRMLTEHGMRIGKVR